MKIRTREINILSMSALDLFCCALGAFILLALMEARYVPHLGPKAEEVQSLKQQNEQMRKQLENMQQLLKSQQLDLVFVIDTSSSMGPPLNNLKSEILSFAKILGKLSPKARMQVIEYKDACWPSGFRPGIRRSEMVELDQQGAQKLNKFTGDMVAESPECKRTGNRPASENVGGAFIYAADEAPWAALPDNRYLVVLGDEPPDPNLAGLEDKVIQRAKAWAQAGSRLSTVFADSPNVTDPNRSRAFYQNLANAGGGTMTISGTQSFTLILLEAMTK